MEQALKVRAQEQVEVVAIVPYQIKIKMVNNYD